MYFLACDIGGTKLEGAVFKVSPEESTNCIRVELPGQSVWLQEKSRHRLPTERVKGYLQIIDKLKQIVELSCKDWAIKPSMLGGMGIGMPGTVHPQTKQLLVGNALVFKEKNIESDLREKIPELTASIYIENDANLFALAENYAGAGLRYQNEFGIPTSNQVAVGVILGTGVGSGVVYQGKLLRGRRGGAGEAGHIQLHSNGPACLCGGEGCAETYLSGVAIEAHMNSRRYSQVSELVTAKQVFELAESGEPTATGVVKKYKKDLAKFGSILANAYDPDFIVFGGGMSLQPSIYQGLSENIARHSFLAQPIPTYQNQLGDSAGIIGAAILPIIQSNL